MAAIGAEIPSAAIRLPLMVYGMLVFDLPAEEALRISDNVCAVGEVIPSPEELVLRYNAAVGAAP